MVVDRALLLHLCRLVEQNLVEGFAREKTVSFKSGHEIVTSVDLAVSDLLCAELHGCGFKPSQILSEERDPGEVAAAHDGSCWLIDPIDGTKEFAAGIAEFALSIAYQEGGRVRAAAVFNPLSRVLVSGSLDEGLWVGDVRVSAAEIGTRSAPEAQVLCSRTEHAKGLLDRFMLRRSTLPVGSVAYKLALVAAGRYVATVSYEPKNSWDIAAGVFLTELGGGRVSDIKGRPLTFADPLKRLESGLIATAPGVDHDEYLELFAACGNLN